MFALMAGHFGFEGACQCTFTEGPFFGGVLTTGVGPAGSPQENGFVEGQLMTFRVERRKKSDTHARAHTVPQSHAYVLWLTLMCT